MCSSLALKMHQSFVESKAFFQKQSFIGRLKKVVKTLLKFSSADQIAFFFWNCFASTLEVNLSLYYSAFRIFSIRGIFASKAIVSSADCIIQPFSVFDMYNKLKFFIIFYPLCGPGKWPSSFIDFNGGSTIRSIRIAHADTSVVTLCASLSASTDWSP